MLVLNATENPFQTQFIIKEDVDINFNRHSSLIFKEKFSLNPLHNIRNIFVGKSNQSHENSNRRYDSYYTSSCCRFKSLFKCFDAFYNIPYRYHMMLAIKRWWYLRKNNTSLPSLQAFRFMFYCTSKKVELFTIRIQ